MKNILITGGAGYIGSHIVFELIKKKIKFVALDNFSTNNNKNSINKFILKVNIGDNKKINKILIKKKIKTIIFSICL